MGVALGRVSLLGWVALLGWVSLGRVAFRWWALGRVSLGWIGFWWWTLGRVGLGWWGRLLWVALKGREGEREGVMFTGLLVHILHYS